MVFSCCNAFRSSHKTPSFIHLALKFLTKSIDECKNSFKNFTLKVDEHISREFLMPSICIFDSIENKHNVYRGEYCIERFPEFLRENAMKIINFEKKKMITLKMKSRNPIKRQTFTIKRLYVSTLMIKIIVELATIAIILKLQMCCI